MTASSAGRTSRTASASVLLAERIPATTGPRVFGHLLPSTTAEGYGRLVPGAIIEAAGAVERAIGGDAGRVTIQAGTHRLQERLQKRQRGPAILIAGPRPLRRFAGVPYGARSRNLLFHRQALCQLS